MRWAGGTDARLVVPAAVAWAAMALAWGSEGQRVVAVATLVAAVASLVLAHRVVRARAVATTLAVGLAFAGLLLAVPTIERDLEHCSAMTLELGGHAAPMPARVVEAACGDETLVDVRVVVVVLEAGEADVALGDTVTATCEAWPGDAGQADAWRLACEDVERTDRAWWAGWSAAVRAGLRDATAHLPGDGGALLPGLAIGDTSLVTPALDAAMLQAGLTHLTAVSGANCAIVVGLALGATMALGLRRWARSVIAGLALAAFVVLVGPEPSVVRASIMAGLALVALHRGVRRVGVALLALAVLVALLVDPTLARSAGFALSVLATAGLLVHAQPLAEALARRMPLPVAAAIGVPLAAQLWCLPVLVVLDPRLALVAVPANVLAAPAAPVATVLGLVVCAVAVVAPAVAAAVAWLAWLPSAWIAGLAHASTLLPPGPPWPAGWLGVALAVAVVGAVGAGVAARRTGRGAAAAIGVVVLATGSVHLPTLVARATLPDWTIAQCDVGQGAATVLRLGDATVLIDTGREPEPVAACLDLLGIGRLDVLVLTHFDADHVGGVDAVAGRSDLVVHGPPDDEAPALLDDLADRGARLHAGAAGESVRVGDGALDLLWPEDRDAVPGNDASLVVAASLGDRRVLVLGDLGAEAQRALLADGVPASDVVVVAHHGSPDQHLPLYDAIDADVALVPVGPNDYGHPAPDLMAELERRGMIVLRTDERGTLALDGVVVWSQR
ncbi:ComEC/Rec2 family competence protein [Agrococcus sp. SGAir0287]|uniref:ComEC/Rec2 family competence protein n=1 Tax=Agrococcus sp. SGAir0287 TaxID=2070347 RepID=UPI0010CD38CC|nr:ComEC/Rec2 family competence protein [Agrococcus sp. SGAir0287]QCR19461.1 competence protein ComEC [Agrococcus sp. SGAir0287]